MAAMRLMVVASNWSGKTRVSSREQKYPGGHRCGLRDHQDMRHEFFKEVMHRSINGRGDWLRRFIGPRW